MSSLILRAATRFLMPLLLLFALFLLLRGHNEPGGGFVAGLVVAAAFVLACRNGHTDAARFLLDRGADIDSRGFFGGTGLHWAALNGHAGTVRFLLDHGADPALRDAEFDSDALGWAREGGHERVVALLA